MSEYEYYSGVIKITTLLKDLTLKDIIPHNIYADPAIQAIIAALDPELQEITLSIQEAEILTRIDELDGEILDLLAWQFHADYYDLAATLTMKREYLKNALLLHMKKGTVWAIREALRHLDITAEFFPWWESGDDPYTFRMVAIVGGEFYRSDAGREHLMKNIRRAVNDNKSARSFMTKLEAWIREQEGTEIYAGLATLLDGWERIRIAHPTGETQQDYAGIVNVKEFALDLGVDLDTMHELLLRFEKRIFDRMDTQEVRLMTHIAHVKDEIDARFDRLEEMLRWSGNDE